jgi:uncharacterized protein with PIN domain/sulfur carrier protein ThiS
MVDGHVDVRAYAELNDFLAPELQGTTMHRPFRPHQTVKDVIEAVGIPHTEIDLIVVNGEPVDFSHHPTVGDRVAVYPMFETLDIVPVARLRPLPLRDPRFVVDVHLGRLARLLRLVGFDARWEHDLDDETLASIGQAEHRIVLTRDRGLLKRRRVTHGLFVRSERPFEQVVDVLRRLDLADRLAPFTRCLRCGGALAGVTKAEVLHLLEPLTREHYDEFHRCVACGQIYWSGSHHDRLADLVEQIRTALYARISEEAALDGKQLLERHVDAFNEGVRTGDFGPMLAGFTHDAELAFEGVPAGPFLGRDAIAKAYRSRPPDDEVRILAVDDRGAEVVARYAWSRQPDRAAGDMRLSLHGDGIARLVVTFD